MHATGRGRMRGGIEISRQKWRNTTHQFLMSWGDSNFVYIFKVVVVPRPIGAKVPRTFVGAVKRWTKVIGNICCRFLLLLHIRLNKLRLFTLDNANEAFDPFSDSVDDMFAHSEGNIVERIVE